MSNPDTLQQIHAWVHTFLLWVGFGTVVGLTAKALMPGRDPGGALTTLLLGIAGSVIGGGVLAFAWEGHRVTPISVIGFFTAMLGTLLLLGMYRLLAGPWLQRQQMYGDAPQAASVARRPFYRRRSTRYEDV